jgi:hypothetical protein
MNSDIYDDRSWPELDTMEEFFKLAQVQSAGRRRLALVNACAFYGNKLVVRSDDPICRTFIVQGSLKQPVWRTYGIFDASEDNPKFIAAMYYLSQTARTHGGHACWLVNFPYWLEKLNRSWESTKNIRDESRKLSMKTVRRAMDCVHLKSPCCHISINGSQTTQCDYDGCKVERPFYGCAVFASSVETSFFSTT